MNDDVARTSVNQAPGGGTDYPFTRESDLAGVVLDFYLSYSDAVCQYAFPFALTIAGTQFTVTDSNAVVVASGALADAAQTTWGARTVYEWHADPVVMRAVVRGDLLVDGTASLDARTLDRLPSRVRSLRVGLIRVTGPVRFEAGYNISLSGAQPEAPIDGGRFVSTVAIDAVPGAGAGRVNGCEDLEPVVRTINRVKPDCGGNFVIEADGCFRAQLPLFVTDDGATRTAEYSAEDLSAEESAHALRVTSECRPCRECDYYVRTYRGLKRVWDRWRTVAADLESSRDRYSANRQRWLDQRDCRIATPARLILAGEKSCKVFVGGSLCNVTACCLNQVEIRFTFDEAVAVGEAYLDGSVTDGEERYAPIVTGKVVRFLADFANPQATTVARMRACISGCTTGQATNVTMTVHWPDPDPDPHSGDTCPTPHVEVPADVLTAWLDAGIDPEGDYPPVRAVITKAAPLDASAPAYNCGC